MIVLPYNAIDDALLGDNVFGRLPSGRCQSRASPVDLHFDFDGFEGSDNEGPDHSRSEAGKGVRQRSRCRIPLEFQILASSISL